MRSCGIIAEYNPFHNGHQWHLREARRQSQADVMVVAMSGNFMQRGEPALIDKWHRAANALANGADLVLEHSVLGSCQPADYFAESGIRLLQAAGCDAFAFGSESGNPEDFEQMAGILLERQEQINEAFQLLRNDGSSYPVQMEAAVRQVAGGQLPAISFWTPNNQLGLAYAKANQTYERPMEMFVVERLGSQHHDQAVPEKGALASATAIRQKVKANEDVSAWVPPETAAALQKTDAVSWEHYWPFLRYKLIVETEQQLRQYYQVEEGIEFRLKACAQDAATFLDFMERVKNKRWTWTRLQRVCLAVLLGIKRERVHSYLKQTPALRVLGFTSAGRAYLKEQKKQGSVWLSRIGREEQRLWETEVISDRVYQLALGSKQNEQNFGRIPIARP